MRDLFYEVYKNINRCEGRSRFSSWLVRITVNEALMKIRSRQSERMVFHIDMSRPEGEHSPILEIEDDRPIRRASTSAASWRRQRFTGCVHYSPKARRTDSCMLTKIRDVLHSPYAIPAICFLNRRLTISRCPIYIFFPTRKKRGLPTMAMYLPLSLLTIDGT